MGVSARGPAPLAPLEPAGILDADLEQALRKSLVVRRQRLRRRDRLGTVLFFFSVLGLLALSAWWYGTQLQNTPLDSRAAALIAELGSSDYERASAEPFQPGYLQRFVMLLTAPTFSGPPRDVAEMSRWLSGANTAFLVAGILLLIVWTRCVGIPRRIALLVALMYVTCLPVAALGASPCHELFTALLLSLVAGLLLLNRAQRSYVGWTVICLGVALLWLEGTLVQVVLPLFVARLALERTRRLPRIVSSVVLLLLPLLLLARFDPLADWSGWGPLDWPDLSLIHVGFWPLVLIAIPELHRRAILWPLLALLFGWLCYAMPTPDTVDRAILFIVPGLALCAGQAAQRLDSWMSRWRIPLGSVALASIVALQFFDAEAVTAYLSRTRHISDEEADFLMGERDVRTVFMSLRAQEVPFLRAHGYRDHYQSLDSISREDVMGVIERLFSTGQRTLVVLGPDCMELASWLRADFVVTRVRAINPALVRQVFNREAERLDLDSLSRTGPEGIYRIERR